MLRRNGAASTEASSRSACPQASCCRMRCFSVASLAVDPAEFLAWGWRVPFLASGVLVGVGLFIRVSLTESPEFADISPPRPRAADAGAGRDARQSAGGAAGGRAATSASARSAIWSSSTTSHTRPRVLRMPLTTVLTLLLVAACFFGVAVVAFARWSDRVGRRRVMLWGNARAGGLGRAVLSTDRHRLRAGHCAGALRNAHHPGRVHRDPTGGVRRAVSGCGSLQRHVAGQHAGHDRRRRTGAVHRRGALRGNWHIAGHWRLRHRRWPSSRACRPLPCATNSGRPLASDHPASAAP